jgi:hypothetical protein
LLLSRRRDLLVDCRCSCLLCCLKLLVLLLLLLLPRLHPRLFFLLPVLIAFCLNSSSPSRPLLSSASPFSALACAGRAPAPRSAAPAYRLWTDEHVGLCWRHRRTICFSTSEVSHLVGTPALTPQLQHAHSDIISEFVLIVLVRLVLPGRSSLLQAHCAAQSGLQRFSLASSLRTGNHAGNAENCVLIPLSRALVFCNAAPPCCTTVCFVFGLGSNVNCWKSGSLPTTSTQY